VHQQDAARHGHAQVQTSAERRRGATAAARRAVLADRGLRVAAAAAGAWVGLYALVTLLLPRDGRLGQTVGDVVYLLPVALAATLSVVVSLRTRGRTRRTWVLLSASNTAWLVGEVIWAGYHLSAGTVPFPSVADAFYLLSYVLVLPALFLAFAGASVLRRVRGLGDALLVAGALGTAGWTLLLAPQLRDGASLAALTGVAYPLLGVAILVVLVTVGLQGHRQVSPAVLLVGLAFAVSAVTDTGYTYVAVLHTYTDGSWLELGWQAEAVLLCLAALVVLRHGEHEPEVDPGLRQAGIAPIALAVAVVMALMSLESWQRSVDLAVLGLAVLATAYVVVRFMLVLREQRGLTLRLQATLAEQERLAITDGLTGLYNRRFFGEMLRLEGERAHREGLPLALLVLDLDHFKQVNDRFGHTLGDRVLVEAAHRLRTCARATDVLARWGGEEFVLLLPGRDEDAAREVAERCRRAMRFRPFTTEDGAWIRVTVSVGAAVTGLQGDVDPDRLVLEADHALYAAKDLGRDRVAGRADLGTHDGAVPDQRVPGTSLPSGLVRLAERVERTDGMAGHSRAVAAWAERVSEVMELTALQRNRLDLAARLHDLGKLSAPEALLATPLPDSREWDVIHRYPEVGSLVLGTSVDLADVARVVRALREWYDGSGYPDGRAGDAIPVEARVLAVCDAWAAIRLPRPQSAPRGRAEAREELRAARGTQFDPAVVDVFLTLEAAGLVGSLPGRDAPEEASSLAP
jgi:two-component system, cell cycle response regulator